MPVIFLTACAIVGNGLGVSLFDPGHSTRAEDYKSVLVVGGSSGVGASVIQILRLTMPNAKIFTTASAQYSEHLKDLGADRVSEKPTQDHPAKIIAASPGWKGVDAIVDAVGAAATRCHLGGVESRGDEGVFAGVYKSRRGCKGGPRG